MTRAWRSNAACRSADADLFFPAAEEGPEYDAQVATAKAVCARCSVRAECLAEALIRIPYGIAGGTTPEERRGLRPAPVPGVVLEAGLAPGAARSEIEAAGRALLAAGRSTTEVARRCGVSRRTATRWAARSRAPDPCAEGSRGGNRAPLLISETHTPAMDTSNGRTRA